MLTRRLPSALLALLLAFSLLAACGGGGGASAAGMRLRKTEGAVAVRDDGGADVTLKENLNLYSGYGVATQAASYAWIDLDATKLTKLDENSEAAVTQDGKALTLDVLTGNLYFNITEPLAEDETLDIRTSTMVTGIRGTRGWVTQESVCLLEGTVTVTAGEQSVTVTAGRMARLTPEGVLETAPLPYQDMPAFVKAETPAPAEGATPATYEEQLAAVENLVYAEMVDFEQDGDPELLTISIRPNTAHPELDVGQGIIAIYRQEADGVRRLGGNSTNMHIKGSFSLVEYGGRQYVRFYQECEWYDDIPYYGSYIFFVGPAAPAADGSVAWGTVDQMQLQFNKESGRPTYYWGWPRGENGLMEGGTNWVSWYERGDASAEAAYTAEVEKYTFVRDLVLYDGQNVTVIAP